MPSWMDNWPANWVDGWMASLTTRAHIVFVNANFTCFYDVYFHLPLVSFLLALFMLHDNISDDNRQCACHQFYYLVACDLSPIEDFKDLQTRDCEENL